MRRTVTAAPENVSREKRRRGGNPQDAHFNKLARALHGHYKELKEAYSTTRGSTLGKNPGDILVGNRVKTFSKLCDFLRGKPDLESYYHAEPLPHAHCATRRPLYP